MNRASISCPAATASIAAFTIGLFVKRPLGDA